jgi:hypothetical protein
MRIKKNNVAISEMFGTVLLLLIAVVSFSIIQFNILSNEFTQDQPFVTIVGEIKGKNIILLHRGGKSLSLETKVNFEIDGNISNIIIGENDYLDSTSKEDSVWNIGESLIFKQDLDLNNLKVKVTVIDVERNTVVMSEVL